MKMKLQRMSELTSTKVVLVVVRSEAVVLWHRFSIGLNRLATKRLVLLSV
jgi:hypothetical protein